MLSLAKCLSIGELVRNLACTFTRSLFHRLDICHSPIRIGYGRPTANKAMRLDQLTADWTSVSRGSRMADHLAVLMAISLPWSTTIFGVFAAAGMISKFRKPSPNAASVT